MFKKIEQMAKSNFWLTLLAVAVLFSGGIAAFIAVLKSWFGKAKDVVGVA